MNLNCNIDSRGRIARLIYGLVLIAGGIAAMILWAWPTGGWLAWTVSWVAFAGGAFAVFEARAGWCAMRAMGFKTPM